MQPNYVNISPYPLPVYLAIVSYKVKRLKPNQFLEVKFKPDQLEGLKKWSLETNNRLEVLNENLCRVVRGKGFHGVCFNEKISFYLTGVKLHIKEFLLKAPRKYPPYLVNFISIPEGERAIEKLKRVDIKAVVLPAPKEIEGYCGFALGFFDQKEAFEVFSKLLKEGIGVEALFKKEGGRFKKLVGAWEI